MHSVTGNKPPAFKLVPFRLHCHNIILSATGHELSQEKEQLFNLIQVT